MNLKKEWKAAIRNPWWWAFVIANGYILGRAIWSMS